jgi:aldehyde dehydrogenase (NAD+)
MADADAIDAAIGAADAATEPMRETKAYERQPVLDHFVRRFRERAEELAMILYIDDGKEKP